MLAGEFPASRSHFDAGLALYDPNSHRLLTRQTGSDPQVVSQGWLGLVLFCLGFPEQALARSRAAVEEARRLAHPPSLASSLSIGTRVLSLIGDDAAVDKWTGQLVAVATEQSYPHWLGEGTALRGWVSVKKGALAEGISLLRNGIAAYRATGAELYIPHHLALLARACDIAGQFDEAMSSLDDALRIVERTGERWFAAELHRHKGELHLRQGCFEAAEEQSRQALNIARKQGAKLWELRTAMSLARLRRDHGRHSAARDLLAPVYDWFTEGFDTPDMKETKGLLDSLIIT